MKTLKSTGIIINRLITGDANRFYTIMTREYGKISVFARSVRTIKSKRASSLDLFSEINFEMYKTGTSYTLTHVDLITSHRYSKQKLGDISRLFQMGELIDELLPEEDPHYAVYELLQKALANLASFDTPQYLLRFKLRLLKELGYENKAIKESELDSYIESIMSNSLSKILI